MEQKKEEAQELAELLIDAETRIGELTKLIKGAKNQYDASNSGVTSKIDQLKDLGLIGIIQT